jgi:hypothetical protein
MDFDLAFLLNIVGIFLAFGLVMRLYIWPGLRPLPQDRTLKILMLPHTFRFVGLSFLFYGVVSPELPSKAAVPAAWGDFAAAILALIAMPRSPGAGPSPRFPSGSLTLGGRLTCFTRTTTELCCTSNRGRSAPRTTFQQRSCHRFLSHMA